jgi:hypothetical protein
MKGGGEKMGDRRMNKASLSDGEKQSHFRGKAIGFKGAASALSLNITEFRGSPWVHFSRVKKNKVDRMTMKAIEFCSMVNIYESHIRPQIIACQEIIAEKGLSPEEHEEDESDKIDSISAEDMMMMMTKPKRKDGQKKKQKKENSGQKLKRLVKEEEGERAKKIMKLVKESEEKISDEEEEDDE